MPIQRSASIEPWPAEANARNGVVVASGYGVRISVWRGRLRVDDGSGRDRRTYLYHRATSGLKRLVVLGHTGYVSLEALRWLADIKAAYLQIDADGRVLATFGPPATDRPSLRRARPSRRSRRRHSSCRSGWSTASSKRNWQPWIDSLHGSTSPIPRPPSSPTDGWQPRQCRPESFARRRRGRRPPTGKRSLH
jgi:hypothetical protein